MKRLICLLFLTVSIVFSAGEGTQTVTTAGQPVQLAATLGNVTVCTITPLARNAGTIWLGFDSGVSASGNKGTPLVVGATYSCNYAGPSFWSLNNFWLDASNSGDGVSYTWK